MMIGEYELTPKRELTPFTAKKYTNTIGSNRLRVIGKDVFPIIKYDDYMMFDLNYPIYWPDSDNGSWITGMWKSAGIAGIPHPDDSGFKIAYNEPLSHTVRIVFSYKLQVRYTKDKRTVKPVYCYPDTPTNIVVIDSLDMLENVLKIIHRDIAEASNLPRVKRACSRRSALRCIVIYDDASYDTFSGDLNKLYAHYDIRWCTTTTSVSGGYDAMIRRRV